MHPLPSASAASRVPAAGWSPITALSSLERTHAVIDLLYAVRGAGLTDTTIGAIQGIAIRALAAALLTSPSDPALQAIGADLAAGLNDAGRLKQALDGLHRLDIRPGINWLEAPPGIDVTDPFLSDGRPSSAGRSSAASADVVFLRVLDALDGFLSAHLQRTSPGLQTQGLGSTAAHRRVLTRALRSSLTGHPFRIELDPPSSADPLAHRPSAALLEGWHAQLAQSEPALRRMAALDLMPPPVVTRRSPPSWRADAWTATEDGQFISTSASFADELPLLLMLTEDLDFDWIGPGEFTSWFLEQQADWARLRREDLQHLQLEIAHGRRLSADETRALAHLMDELDDKIEWAGRAAELQGSGGALAEAGNDAINDLVRWKRRGRIAPLLPLLQDSPDMAPLLEQIRATDEIRFAAASSALAWPASLESFLPMPALKWVTPGLAQVLDREDGSVTFLREGRALARMKVPALRHYRSRNPRLSRWDAEWRQDLDLFTLELFILRHLRPRDGRSPIALLPRLELRGREIRAGDLVLAATNTPIADYDSSTSTVTWQPDRDNVATALRLLRPGPPPAADAAHWGAHGLNLPLPDEPPAPAAPPKRLRLIFQLDDSAQGYTAAWLQYRKHAGEAAWLQRGGENRGEARILRGQALLNAAGDATQVRIALVGRSGRLDGGSEQGLAGWPSWRLAGQLDVWLTELALAAPARGRISGIQLVSCDVASPGLDPNFATRFLKTLDTYEWARGVPLTAPTGELHLTESRGDGGGAGKIRKLTMHVQADGTRRLTHHRPGDLVVMTYDRDSASARVVDRHPAPPGILPSDERFTASDLDWLHDVAMDSPGAKAVRELFSDHRGTPLERVMAGIADDALGPPQVLREVSRISADNALDHLRALGLIEAGTRGSPRLRADRLSGLIAGRHEAALLRSAAALLQLSDFAFDRLVSTVQGAARRFLDKARTLRTSLREQLRRIDWNALSNQGLGGINTMIGAAQLAHGWQTMDMTMRGLSLTQLGGVVITPLTLRLGAALSRSAGRSRVLSAISCALAGGVADVGLSGLGLVVLGLQWREFHRSGLDTDTHAHRSLVANTVLASLFTAFSLATNGVQLATAYAGGASAVAGTSLGTAFSVAGAAALPAALLAMATFGAVNTGLWLDEYGAFIRRGTSSGDAFLAGLALTFGFQTDVIRRAEVEKLAIGEARKRSAARRAAWEADLAFRGASLAKAGYGRIRHPDLAFPVKHATFKIPGANPPYTFVLQDRAPVPRSSAIVTRPHADARAADTVSTAWLDVHEMRTFELPGASTAKADQLFELFGAAGDFKGGAGHDRFLLDARSHASIDGGPGTDELVFDATGLKVKLLARQAGGYAGTGKYQFSVDDIATGKTRHNDLAGIERWTIQNAAEVDLLGGPGDEHFDVTAGRARIEGGGGRNVYLLRGGNRIVVSSADTAFWPRGVSATIEFLGRAAALELRVDGLHESIAWRRSGDDLLLRCAGDTLTLARYFLGTGAPHDPPVVIVDATQVRMMWMNAQEASDRDRPSASMNRHLFLDARVPASRRSLTGENARTRHHLMAGGGDFCALPRTAVPMDIALEVPVERLRHRRVEDDLVIEEVAPADAAASYRPLRLTLPRRARADAGEQPPLALWARAQGRSGADALLLMPSPGGPDGAMRLAQDREAPGTRPSDPPPRVSLPANAGLGTPGDDVIDAGAVHPRAVMTGGDGADTYRVPAGLSAVIDNSASDSAHDVLHLAIAPADLRLRRDGDDLVIEGGGSTVRIREHAVNPLARRLTLTLVGYPGMVYALPVIHESGLMVYSPDGANGANCTESEVPGFIPGRHLVLAAPDAPWTPRPARRRAVLLRHHASARIEGRSLLLTSHAGPAPGPASSTVFLQDYYLAPEHHRPDPMTRDKARVMEDFTGDPLSPLLPEELETDWRRYQTQGADASIVALLRAQGIVDERRVKAISRIARDVRSAQASDPGPYELAAVRTYFRLKGLPPDIATRLRSMTPAQVRRGHHVLAAASAAGTMPPASYIDGYAASPAVAALSATAHGELLRHLIVNERSWTYAERVLSHGIALDMLEAFETWSGPRPAGPDGQDRPDGSLAALDDLVRLLGAKPGDALAATADTPALLELILRVRGRPPEVAKALAAAMTAVDTLDEDWVDGMQRAGVDDHAMLKRLHAARVPVEDLVRGNARRAAYEGSGDRTALIQVGTRGDLGEERSWGSSRLVLTKHLRLDRDGDWFDRADDHGQSGIAYELTPGELVLPTLRADQDIAVVAALHDDARQRAARRFPQGSGSGWKKDRSAFPHIVAPDPSVRFREAGLARIVKVPARPPAAGWGRSSPSNLVDGSAAPGEATAWRPPAQPGDVPLALVTPMQGPQPSLDFSFKDALALTRFELAVAPAERPGNAPRRSGAGSWSVHAVGPTGQELTVSRGVRIDGREPVRIDIDTRGVPYRRYRLTGFAGHFAPDTWFTEVSFTTADAGATPASDPVRQAGLLVQAAATQTRSHGGPVTPGPPAIVRTSAPLALLTTQAG